MARGQWKNFSELRKIPRSISGKSYKVKLTNITKIKKAISMSGENFGITDYSINEPVKIRLNEGQLEYTTSDINIPGVYEESKVYDMGSDIYMTSAGEIDLYDEGEFGGKLCIGGSFKMSGNFKHIFIFKNRKFVIDSLKHMMSRYFKLYEVFDNGNIALIYDANEINKNIEKTNKYYSIGLEVVNVTEDSIYFLCNGVIRNFDATSENRWTDISYIIEYDGVKFKKLELPELNSYYTNSFVILDNILYLGCDKQITTYNFNTKEIEIYTPLSKTVEKELLKH